MFPFKRAIRSALLDCGCTHWMCWKRWRTWLIVVTALIYFVVILIVVPLLTYTLYAIKAEAQFSVCLVAGIFVLLTIPIFLANLLQHLVNYTCPNLQAYIIRTIWIVPIYSVDSVRNYLSPTSPLSLSLSLLSSTPSFSLISSLISSSNPLFSLFFTPFISIFLPLACFSISLPLALPLACFSISLPLALPLACFSISLLLALPLLILLSYNYYAYSWL